MSVKDIQQERTFEVTLRFQFPAWDEKDGITYTLTAKDKMQARRYASRQADADGHLCGGKGRATFTAVEVESATSSESDDFAAIHNYSLDGQPI